MSPRAVPDPAPADNAALAPPERLHPLYLITGLGKSVRGAWGLVASGVVFGSQGRWWLVMMIGSGFAAFSIGALLIKWLKLEYRVGAHDVRIDSGFLSRTSRAIPFDRITDVDIEQGPLHRLFGLARVRFETGASAGARDDDGVLDTITLARAEALREHIRNRRGQPAVAAAVDRQEDVAPLFAMDTRRVLTAGLFNFSLAVLAGLFGVTQTIGDVIGFDPFRRRFWIDLVDRSGPLRDLMLAHQYLAAIGGSVMLILLGASTGIIRTALREHGFRLDRNSTGLRRRRGLVTLSDVSLPVKRVQAAIVGTGPLRRRLGWCEVKLQNLAMDGAKGDHVVAPLAHPREAAAILASLGWPDQPAPEHWRAVSRGHVTAFAAVMAPAVLIAVAIAWLFQPGVLLIAIAALTAIVARYLGWRQTRYALDGTALFIDSGWWRRRRAIVPVAKIQSVELGESFWTRAFDYCSLTLGVAGSGGRAHVVPALSRATAEQLRQQLLAA